MNVLCTRWNLPEKPLPYGATSSTLDELSLIDRFRSNVFRSVEDFFAPRYSDLESYRVEFIDFGNE